AGIYRLKRHPDAYLVVARCVIVAESFILMPRRWCANPGWLQDGVFKLSVRVWSQQLFRYGKRICTKDCFLQLGREIDRVDYLGRGLRLIIVLVGTDCIEECPLSPANLFSEKPVKHSPQKFYLFWWTDLLKAKVAMLLIEANLFFS